LYLEGRRIVDKRQRKELLLCALTNIAGASVALSWAW
jgi:hypothetical protein